MLMSRLIWATDTPQGGRRHELEDAAHAFIPGGPVPARQEPQALQGGELDGQLQDPAQEGAPGQDQHRGVEPGGGHCRCQDQCDVEQYRREGRQHEAAEGVEDARRQGHQGNAQDVGENDAGEIHRELELVRRGGEARGGDQDDEGSGQHSQQGDQEQGQGQHRGHPADEQTGGVLASAILVLCQHRHEGLGEGALGEQPAQQVGQLEGHEEGIGGHTGTKHPGDDGVPHEAQHPGEQGHGADGEQGAQQIHGPAW